MQIELKTAREIAGITAEKAARAAGLGTAFYMTYENKGMIPCKYAYRIWKEFPQFPLPDDFFYYTSYTLQCNMDYAGLTQKDIAREFGISSQGNVSNILKKNIPMYELKEDFNRVFNPLVVPCVADGTGTLRPVTELFASGNFMNRKRKRNIEHKESKIMFINGGEST